MSGNILGVGSLTKAIEQALAQMPDPWNRIGCGQDLERGERGCETVRASEEKRGQRDALQGGHYSRWPNNGRDAIAIRQRFAKRSKVRADAEVLLSSSESESETGAHLVENEQGSRIVRNAGRIGQIRRSRHLGLECRNDHTSDVAAVRIECLAQDADAVVLHLFCKDADSGWDADRTWRRPVVPSVIAAMKDNVAPCHSARDPDRRGGRVGSGAHERAGEFVAGN